MTIHEECLGYPQTKNHLFGALPDGNRKKEPVRIPKLPFQTSFFGHSVYLSPRQTVLCLGNGYLTTESAFTYGV